MKKIFSPLISLISLIAIAGLFSIGGVVTASGEEDFVQSNSYLGSYLSGRYASGKNDTQEAANFMRRALDYDPGNRHILEQAFLLELMTGDWERTTELSGKLIAVDPGHPFARLYRGVNEFRNKNYEAADANFLAGNEGPLGSLIGRIAQAWMHSELGNYQKAIQLLSQKSDTDWVRDYQQYHRALIADVNNKTADAKLAYARLYRKYHQMSRLVGSYAQFLAKSGDHAGALKILGQHFDKARFRHPDLLQLRAQIKARQPVTSYVTNAPEGLAEIFFSLGDRRAENGGVDDGMIFLQLSRLLRPDFTAANYALGSLLFRAKKYDRAMVFLNDVTEKDEQWQDAQILRAQCLSAKGAPKTAISLLEAMADKKSGPDSASENSSLSTDEIQHYTVKSGDTLWTVAEAVYGDGRRYEELLELNSELDPTKIKPGLELVIAHSVTDLAVRKAAKFKANKTMAVVEVNQDIDLYNALGKLYLDEKSYKDAVANYTKAIVTLKKPRGRDWFYYYGRGISFERLKDWPSAEKDFKQALKLSPNRPDVLNYLGYSWVDQNLNLSDAMKLIRRAVKLRPNSGYYVDSLGWAHYRLGQYKEAVTYLEKAVALQPDDPVINDHLADAYWRAGRQLDAKFQWKHVFSLKPESDLLENLNKKILYGLMEKKQAQADLIEH